MEDALKKLPKFAVLQLSGLRRLRGLAPERFGVVRQV